MRITQRHFIVKTILIKYGKEDDDFNIYFTQVIKYLFIIHLCITMKKI